jgi:quinol monooxygenase YgiN
MRFREMDERVSYRQQRVNDGGPIALINEFNVPTDDVDRFLEVWAHDAAYMKQQKGFISAQLHRGTQGSTTFVNVAVWVSARALGDAVRSSDALDVLLTALLRLDHLDGCSVELALLRP